YAYLPFGGGPRICIGNAFALMEMVLLAATVLQRYQVQLDQVPPETEFEVVMRPRGGVRVRALRRLRQGRVAPQLRRCFLPSAVFLRPFPVRRQQPRLTPAVGRGYFFTSPSEHDPGGGTAGGAAGALSGTGTSAASASRTRARVSWVVQLSGVMRCSV